MLAVQLVKVFNGSHQPMILVNTQVPNDADFIILLEMLNCDTYGNTHSLRTTLWNTMASVQLYDP